MERGTTVRVQINEHRDGYLKAKHEGHQFSISGEGAVGDKRTVRVIKEKDDTIIGVTVGATLRLRIDDVVDESTVRADPSYGPVFIRSPLTVGEWWNCVVADVEDDRVIAKPRSHVPRNSDIERGPPPEDPTQSLNSLLNGRKL